VVVKRGTAKKCKKGPE